METPTADRSPAVSTRDLVKTFDGARALDGLDLTVEQGTIVGLLGPNGAGKTTTINILSTLISPDSGTASVAGHDVVADAAAVRRSIALTGQYASVDEELTGTENLVLFGRLLGLSRADAARRAAELHAQMGLSDAADARARTYSGGMRRRLDLAASLTVTPAVLFLDEPTTGLDPASRLDLWNVVRALRDSGMTILLTTQYLEEADVLADRIVVIDRGRVIAEGTADDLKARVGGTVCEVVPLDPNEAAPAAEALVAAGVAATGSTPGSETPMVEVTDGRLSLPAPDGPATLTRVVTTLERAGIVLADISLRRPSLDDVFLALTGTSTAADSTPEPSAPAVGSE